MFLIVWLVSISVDPTVCASDVRIEISNNDLGIVPYFPKWVCLCYLIIIIEVICCVCMIRPVGRGGAGGCMCTPLSD